MSVVVEHQPENQEFMTTVEGHSGELAYSLPAEGVIDFTHTFVDQALRGKGVAEALAREALAYARQQKLQVRTSCEYMKGFVQQHPEYHSLQEAQ